MRRVSSCDRNRARANHEHKHCPAQLQSLLGTVTNRSYTVHTTTPSHERLVDSRTDRRRTVKQIVVPETFLRTVLSRGTLDRWCARQERKNENPIVFARWENSLAVLSRSLYFVTGRGVPIQYCNDVAVNGTRLASMQRNSYETKQRKGKLCVSIRSSSCCHRPLLERGCSWSNTRRQPGSHHTVPHQVPGAVKRHHHQRGTTPSRFNASATLAGLQLAVQRTQILAQADTLTLNGPGTIAPNGRYNWWAARWPAPRHWSSLLRGR